MAKILFIHPYAESEFARQSIPISLISTLLKKHGHICEIFDTTFLDNEILRGIRPDHDKTLAANFYFKKWDSGKFIKLKKKGNIFYLLQEKIDSFAPDIITFSFWGSHLHAEGEYFSYHNGLKLINNVNLNKNSITIVGGTIPSSNPEGVLRKEKKINYVIKGESEFVYLDLANAIDRKQNLNNILNLNFLVENKFYSNQLRPLIDPLDQLPDVCLDIYDSNTFYRPYHGKVVRMIDYELSRGCWYRCTFCLSPFQREATYNKAKNFRREKVYIKLLEKF
jgi:hypothetical protein